MAVEKKAPRKLPTQDRSKETVRILIEATSRCLDRKSIAELSVAEVASTAGFNVASLYQYFPTKEALMAACEESALSQLVATLTARAAEVHQTRVPVEQAVHEVVYLALDLFHTHTTRFAPPEADGFLSRKSERWDLIDRIAQVVAAMLAERVEDEPRLANKNLLLAAQLIVHAVAALGYVGRVRQGNAADAATFQREVASMMSRYLVG